MKTDEQRSKGKEVSGVVGGFCLLVFFVIIILYGLVNLGFWLVGHALQFIGYLLGN